MPPILQGLEPTRSSGFGLQHMCPKDSKLICPVRHRNLSSKGCPILKDGLAGLIWHSRHLHRGSLLHVVDLLPMVTAAALSKWAAWWADLEQQKRCCSG
eukprot:jgi/Botrbrau1/9309/Bobra.0111s0033.1